MIVPAATAGSASMDVLLHLHGFTPGYAGAKPDDEGVYRIEQQLAASKRELIGILPQGSATADFNAGAGKAFDADNFINAVFRRLTAESAWDTEQGPAPGRVILSGHSGADQPISEMLDSGEGAAGMAPGKLAGLFLFDSMIASAFGGSVWNYVDKRMKDELDHLRLMKFSNRPKEEVEAEMEAWLRENGFRLQVVYRKGGAYDAAARDIEGKLAVSFGAAAGKVLGPRLLQLMKEHYAVHEITDTARIQHMDVLSGDDAFQKALETLPGGEPGRAGAAGRRARARAAALRGARRAGAGAAGLARRQPGGQPAARPPARTGTPTPRRRRRPRRSRSRCAGTGPSRPEVPQGRVHGPSRRLEGRGPRRRQERRQRRRLARDRPGQGLQARHPCGTGPASKDLDYYDPRSVTIKKAAAGDFDVRLGYNRENQYFTDESWEAVGIDPVKARKVKRVPMLGKDVLVNELVIPTVDATNKYFDDKTKLTDDDRKEIKDSLVSIGGYNRRTTSSGSFSNHSTGCAVDINENLETFQNMHFKAKNDEGKKNTPHLQAFELIAKVVALESGWASWDPWKETDTDKWLEASRLFNRHFALFLSQLLDDALGGSANTDLANFGEAFGLIGGQQVVAELMVGEQDPKKLRTAAAKAKKDKKAETAKWLERVAGDWSHVRAWIEGVVMYEKGGWSYTSEHEGRMAAGKEKRAVKGELHGLIPLHPKLVETLEAGGWTWLIDSTEAKDFMHFEDRKAFEAIKKKSK